MFALLSEGVFVGQPLINPLGGTVKVSGAYLFLLVFGAVLGILNWLGCLGLYILFLNELGWN
ncbi:hypothetical protein Cylst_0662 [Cylindrospermum stagnale PCC 7417]|uniref:Uncharacterized protein n=1 Tax=Cylindrospermum stagnale PCC 7417 TaxID=56107 RepID=K9WT79_9NOST|nr:hypothetical protein [Cylindrospermum stagnale]AFZ22991.1 hypothetical protein Cylst_0662 [Cylindrospermum stagnale PCC 7417]